MPKPKIPNQRKANLEHKKRVERYAVLIQQVYDKLAKEAARYAELVGARHDSPFSFDDYPLARAAMEILRRELVSSIQAIVMSGTSAEWKESNLIQDLVARRVLTAYTGTNKFGEEYSRYFQTNPESLKVFQQRKDEGMNLSTRVWSLSEQYKSELEEALTAAIAPGMPAMELAAQVKHYLKEPDKRFRRIKEKLEDGTIKWRLSDNAKAYHPGRGVYRSSARNAQRLARTEINMAYRTAEQTRWRQFDFVVGYEVKTTQNGHHVEDICDQLAGKYPKDFEFKGWHPQCYSEDSEVLTDEGWKLFKEVSKSDKILSLNPKTRGLEWVGIDDMQCYRHNGEMIRFHNKSLDCLVTPEHRMVYLNKSNGEIRYCQAKDYTKGKGAFYRGAVYQGTERDFMEIEGRRLAFDDFCEFMGYYLSDGSLQHGTGVIIAQSNDQPAFEPILAVTKRMGYSPKICKETIAIYNSALNRYLSQFGRCTEKFIPKEIKTASKRQIQIFLNAFIKCDGYFRKPKSFIGNHGNIFKSDKDERIFFTTSECLAGDLSELLLKVGSRPSFRVQEPHKTLKKDGRVIKGNYRCYSISECYATTATVFNKESVVYRGQVYDLTLDRNHIMYIRRNGKCFWGSNCMCYTIPILKTEEEFWDLDESKPSVNEVKDVPDNFKEWIADNSDRIEKAESGKGTLPYFIRDNREVVDTVLRRKSLEKAVSDSEKAISNPDYRSIPKENNISAVEIKEQERIEANRREYERLLADPHYTDVEFNPVNGGLKARHDEHENHISPKENKFFLDDPSSPNGLSSTDLELICQDMLYKNGYSCILESEHIFNPNTGKQVTSLDTTTNGMRVDIRSITENKPNTISNGIKAKKKQLRKFNELNETNYDSLILYFHNPSYYDENVVRSNLGGIIKKIIIVMRNGIIKEITEPLK